MTMRAFIKKHRKKLDEAIARGMGVTVEDLQYRNDRERELWIRNDEGLYLWARREGVAV